MHDAGHVEELLKCECCTAIYQKAFSKAFNYDAERLNLAQQQQLQEYIDILRICAKFRDNITAIKMNIKEYARNKKTV